MAQNGNFMCILSGWLAIYAIGRSQLLENKDLREKNDFKRFITKKNQQQWKEKVQISNWFFFVLGKIMNGANIEMLFTGLLANFYSPSEKRRITRWIISNK